VIWLASIAGLNQNLLFTFARQPVREADGVAAACGGRTKMVCGVDDPRRDGGRDGKAGTLESGAEAIARELETTPGLFAPGLVQKAAFLHWKWCISGGMPRKKY
jgi:hypothetical protein